MKSSTVKFQTKYQLVYLSYRVLLWVFFVNKYNIINKNTFLVATPFYKAVAIFCWFASLTAHRSLKVIWIIMLFMHRYICGESHPLQLTNSYHY